MPTIERSLHPQFLSNAYLVYDEPGGTAVIVDSGAPPEPLLESIERNELTPTHLLLTHHHDDHVERNARLQGALRRRDPRPPARGGPPVRRRPHDRARRSRARDRGPALRRSAHPGSHRRDAQLRVQRRRRLHRRHALQGLGRRRQGARLDDLRRPQGVGHGRAADAAARDAPASRPHRPDDGRRASGSTTPLSASGAGSTARATTAAPSGTAARPSSSGRPTTTAATRPGSAGTTMAPTTSSPALRSSGTERPGSAYWLQTGHWPGPEVS